MSQHAIERARRRLGVELDDAAMRGIARSVRLGHFSILGKNADGTIIYRVPIGDQMAATFYSPKTGQIVTMMPAEWCSASGRAAWAETKLLLAEMQACVDVLKQLQVLEDRRAHHAAVELRRSAFPSVEAARHSERAASRAVR